MKVVIEGTTYEMTEARGDEIKLMCVRHCVTETAESGTVRHQEVQYGGGKQTVKPLEEKTRAAKKKAAKKKSSTTSLDDLK